MRPSWTIGRMIASTSRYCFSGFGVNRLFDGFALAGFRVAGDCETCGRCHRLLRAGRFVFPSLSARPWSHGETVALRVPPEVLLGRTITQLLAGLTPNWRLPTSLEAISRRVRNGGSSGGRRRSDGAIPIFGIAPFRRAHRKATITVVDGASALKGITQRVEGRYLLCGLERLPATIASEVGVVSTGIGSIGGVIVLLLAARHRGPSRWPTRRFTEGRPHYAYCQFGSRRGAAIGELNRAALHDRVLQLDKTQKGRYSGLVSRWLFSTSAASLSLMAKR